MAQIIPFPADAEEPELEALSREALLALAQELREKLAELDAREPEDMMSKAYERWGERHEALEDELDELLDLSGVVRADFMVLGDEVYFNELNTIPGSLAFYLWKASGLDFPKLIEKMVEDALRAHADKNSSVFAYDSSILKKVASGSKGAKR